MEDIILQTSKLSKAYGAKFAVDQVQITIKKGEIYGLIGKNGAGKTSLIRLITGLVHPTGGSLQLFGEESNEKHMEAQSRIGALIERPAYWEDMTAYENLMISRIEKGIPSKKSIQKVLDLVGLQVDNKKVKSFSLGMKQKLGIAMALIGEPEFLILDEPINGLDPTSVVEIRELLKRLNKEKGITILISSHILSELEQIATCYGFIHEGKLVEEISKDELERKCKVALTIKVDNPEKAVVILEEQLGIHQYKVVPNKAVKLYEGMDRGMEISKTLILAGVGIEEMTKSGETLERYFMNVIGGNQYA